jgi:hypothetical protein
MLSPFDIKFFRELQVYASEQAADFRQRIASCDSFEEVKYWTGYMDAIDHLIEECAEIERRITSGKDQ